MSTPVRVRFAPSPTGYLHVGGARTAVYNWCLARHHGGTFILRIEDTDRERSSEEMVEGILEGMRWLGLDCDEGPFHQAERTLLHVALAERALEVGSAYRCFCTPESLTAQREAAEKAGERIFQYPRTCRDLAVEEVFSRTAAGEASCVRFKVPDDESVEWTDEVHGRSGVKTSEIEDFVLLRMDGTPTYHVAVVADDVDMRVTHVIRGDDHLSNTPKQILLYRAAGEEPPRFAHLPLILGPDKKKLSKRTGTTSVTEYRARGYSADAMLNFLALLGWSPGGDREVMTRDELVEAFDLGRVNKSAAVFDTDKLDWLNAEHLGRRDPAALVTDMKPGLSERGLWSDGLEGDAASWFHTVITLLKPRARKVSDLVERAVPFLTTEYAYDEKAAKKHLKGDVSDHVKALREAFAALETFDEATTEEALRAVAERLEVGAGKLIHPTRLALTGQGVSPGIFEVLAVMGRERTLARLDRLVEHLSAT